MKKRINYAPKKTVRNMMAAVSLAALLSSLSMSAYATSYIGAELINDTYKCKDLYYNAGIIASTAVSCDDLSNCANKKSVFSDENRAMVYLLSGSESILDSAEKTNKSSEVCNILAAADNFRKNDLKNTKKLSEFRENLVALAESQIRHRNDKKYYQDYGGDYRMPWCGMFVMWLLDQNGYSVLTDKFAMGDYNSRCAHGPWAVMGGKVIGRQVGNYLVDCEGSNDYGSTYLYKNSVVSGNGEFIPEPGDLVLFTNAGNDIAHIGIVAEYNSKTNDLITVEGNTFDYGYNAVATFNRTNGQTYNHLPCLGILGFVHPNYPEKIPEGVEDFRPEK